MLGLNIGFCMLLLTTAYSLGLEIEREKQPILVEEYNVPPQPEPRQLMVPVDPQDVGEQMMAGVEIEPKQYSMFLPWWYYYYLYSLYGQQQQQQQQQQEPEGPPPEQEQSEGQPSEQGLSQDNGICYCGTQSSNRIVGGEDAPQNKWCWQAQLITWANQQKTSYFLCGGSVICDRYVLTAAHCLYETQDDVSKTEVYLGAYDSYEDQNADLYTVKSFKIHPQYDNSTQNYDIALIELEQKVEYTDAICSVCLPSAVRDYNGQDLWVTGWGNLEEGGESPDTLQQVKVQGVDKTYCEEQYGRELPYILCASGENKDSCQGDSGGPLVTETYNNNHELVGIVSSGHGCAQAEYPGLYTRVDAFLDWIQQNTDCQYCARRIQ